MVAKDKKEGTTEVVPSEFVIQFAPVQKPYLSENWIRRGAPTTEVIWVKDALLSMSTADGLENDGWLKRLKNSARKRMLWRSVILNVLPNEVAVLASLVGFRAALR